MNSLPVKGHAQLKKRVFLYFSIFCSFLFANAVFAQNRVSGKVSSGKENEALPGVTITIKGGKQATSTDANGSFSIEAGENDVLVFKSIGFNTQAIPVAGKQTLTVKLTANEQQLNEVVITALGVTKSTRNIGYAVQTVSGADLTKARDPNPISGLVGKVAGLSVAPSAELLRAPNVAIRGDKVTLYVVDGFPINTDTWNISPDDIETYTVLKGPAAAALYGNRAANGAILITTKKGTKSKKGISVEVNSSTVLNKGFLAFPRTQSKFGPGENTQYEFVDGKGGAPGGVDSDYDIWGPYFNGQLIPQFDSPVVNGVRQGTPWLARGKNNLKDFLQTGYQTDNNVALSASGDNYTTRLSISQQHQQSYIPKNYLDIANFNLYASFNASKRLKFEANIDFNRQTTDNFPDADYGPNSLIYNLSVWTGADWSVNQPIIKNIWQPGKVGVQSEFEEYTRYHNPWFMVTDWTRGHYKNDVYGYLSSNFMIDKHLNATLRTQIDTYNQLRTEKMPFSAHPYGREGNRGDYREDRRDLFDSNTELFLHYDYTIGQFVNLSGLVGGNMRNFSYNSSWTSTDYLNVPGVYSFSNSANPIQATSFNSQMRVLSSYYSFDAAFGKYATLSSTGRIDKSSAFQTPTTYFYPSLSLATVISDYIHLPTAISFLKARASYADVRTDNTDATVGTAPFNSITAFGGSNAASLHDNPMGYGSSYESPYNGPAYSLNSFYSTSKPYNNQTAGYSSSVLYSQNLKTANRVSYEEGLDIKFLRNRLGLSATAFQYVDGPQILANPISSTTGFNTLYVNALKTKKTGLELSLSGSPVRHAGGFTWDVLVNWSTFKNTYEQLPAGQSTYRTFFQNGDRTDKFYGTAFVKTADGQIVNDAAGKPLSNPVAQYMGHFNADYSWSIYNKVRYGNLSMGFQFDGSVGGVTTDYMHLKTMRGGANIETATGAFGAARYQDWANYGVSGYNGTYVGQGVTVSNGQAINFNSANGKILNYSSLQFAQNTQKVLVEDYVSKFYKTQESNLMSKTFSKLREVTLSYDLPKRWLQNTFIEKVTVSAVGRNLLYFYKDIRFKDVDLDQYNNSPVAATGLQSPTVRSYGVNLNLTF